MRRFTIVEAVTGTDINGALHTKYVIEAAVGSAVVREARRYSQFQELHARVLRLRPPARPESSGLPRLTSKKLPFGTSSISEAVVSKRTRKLGTYLNELGALAVVYPAVGDVLVWFLQPDTSAFGGLLEPAPADATPELTPEVDATELGQLPLTPAAPPLPPPSPAGAAKRYTLMARLWGAKPPKPSPAALPSPDMAAEEVHVVAAAVRVEPVSVASSVAPARATVFSAATDEISDVGQAPPSPLAPSSFSSCSTCGRTIPSSETASFCSQQCERYSAALKAHNLSVAGGRLAPSTDGVSGTSMALLGKVGKEKGDRSEKGEKKEGGGWLRGLGLRGGRRRSKQEEASSSALIGGGEDSAGLALLADEPPSFVGSDRSRQGSVDLALAAVLPFLKRPRGSSSEVADALGRVRTASIEAGGWEYGEAGVTFVAPAEGGGSDAARFTRLGLASSARFKVAPSPSSVSKPLSLQSMLSFSLRAFGYAPLTVREASEGSPLPGIEENGEGGDVAPLLSSATWAEGSSSSEHTLLRLVRTDSEQLAAFTGVATSPARSTAGSGAGDASIDLLLRTGLAWKRGAGLGLGLRQTWKVRRLVLNPRSLAYFNPLSGALLGTLRLLHSSTPPAAVLVDLAASTMAGIALAGGPEPSSDFLEDGGLMIFREALFRRCRAAGWVFAEVAALSSEASEELIRALPKELLEGSALSGPFLASITTQEREGGLVLAWESEAERDVWVASVATVVGNEQSRIVALLRSYREVVVTRAWEHLGPSGHAQSGHRRTRVASDLTDVAADATAAVAPPPSRASISSLPHSYVSPGHGSLLGGDAEGHPLSHPRVRSVRFESGALLLPGPTSPSPSSGISSGAAAMAVETSPRPTDPFPTVLAPSSSPVHRGAAGISPSLEGQAGQYGALSPSASLRSGPALSMTHSHGSSGGPGTPSNALAMGSWALSEDEVTITERIGSGSFGEVFRGKLWGTDVAVKLLHSPSKPEERGDDVLASLQSEVTVLASLRHPNVVLYMGASLGGAPPAPSPRNVSASPTQDGAAHAQSLFIVTEWCERGALDDILYDRSIPLSAAARITFALHTARGMAYLHSPRRGIIHRDLKARNLLVTRDWVVKVADFGLTVTSAAPPKKGGESEGEGEGGRGFYGVQGTPQFMAPEVLEGARYDASVDVYAFGIVLAELTARILPYSDTHKRFSFVDAVLEEGAVPTIPRWCGRLEGSAGGGSNGGAGEGGEEGSSAIGPDGLPAGWSEEAATVEAYAEALGLPSAPPSSSPAAGGEEGFLPLGGTRTWRTYRGECTGSLRVLVDACVSRNADSRPSFEALAEVLGILSSQPPRDVFLQLELPRLREALAYGDDTDAAVAGNEIMHAASAALLGALAHLPGSEGGLGSAGLGTLSGSSLALPPSDGGSGRPGSSPPNTMGGRGEGSLLGRMFGSQAAPRATAESTGRVGLTVRFPFASTAFLPLLAFAPPPTSGGVSILPVADLPSLLAGARQLFEGLACRLRANDLSHRARLGLPLRCPDLALAVAGAGATGSAAQQLVVVRPETGGLVVKAPLPASADMTAQGAGHVQPLPSPISPVSVLLASFRPHVARSTASPGAKPTAAAATPTAPIAEDYVAGSARPPTSGLAARMTARGAANAAVMKEKEREREDKARHGGQLSSTAQLVHAMEVLTAVLDASGGGREGETGDGSELTYSALSKLALPPPDSPDALLMCVSAPLIYSLATVAAGCALSPWERAFILRPTGGAAGGSAGKGVSKTLFAHLPDFGSDALHSALTSLIGLWDRLPLLRTPLAHVLAVTIAAIAVGLGDVEVQVPLTRATAVLGAAWVTVPIPEDVVSARFAGVIFERLQMAAVACSAAVVTAGRGLPSRHPLVTAVGARLAGVALRRHDGIILGALEVEAFDPELC